ncbi:uncharacterized protein [Eucyclogobius newberryi]|uniref:uncharacterized protein n=1 Tax=Eucyclogobius newberryi TaxID=166745 RepID=UPI003B59EA89
MLGEAFLRVLKYRDSDTDVENKSRSNRREADGERDNAAKTGPLTYITHFPGGQRQAPVPNRGPPGLLIPGRPINRPPDPVLVDCSLLALYPDLQVADSGPIPAAAKSASPQPLISPPVNIPVHHPDQDQDLDQDQGYLVMGDNVNVSVDVPELRTNSVLNGMLEKKLEEVYLQHLTENLARCHSNLGNSILHGLVPPPQPNGRGLEDSLMVSVEEASTSSERTISYLHTRNAGPCSSNFSSPVLRISEHQD